MKITDYLTHTVKHFAILVILIAASSLAAAEYYVNNVSGNDANKGSKKAPFKTIAKAMSVLKGSDTLKLIPNRIPYNERINIRGRKFAGSLNKPTVIDGQGATIDRLTQRPASQWKNEGGGVFSMYLLNNAWVMDRQGYWSAFPIVFFNGKPASFCRNRKELAPFSYFLFKNSPPKGEKRDPLHNTLYIKLPPGKTPDDIKVATVGMRPTVSIASDNVVVRNLSVKNGAHDGFSTTRAKNIRFENIHASFYMDQGISNHGSETTVINGRFDHCAGGGIVDVYPACRVTYESCLVEKTPFRNAVEFYQGEFRMKNCVIRNNEINAMVVSKKAKLKLENCIMKGDGKTIGIILGVNSQLNMTSCTICRFKTGLHIYPRKPEPVCKLTRCAILDCPTIIYWRTGKGTTAPKLTLSDNFYTPGTITGMGKYTADTAGQFNKKFGREQKSEMKPLTFNGKSIPKLKNRGASGLKWQ